MAEEIEKILKQKDAGDVEPSAWQLMDKINEAIDAVNALQEDIKRIEPRTIF